MTAIRGNAAITWIDADDINTERVLLLREPLRELRPAHQQAVFTADSLDFTQRQVFTIGTGVNELIGRIRFMDDQQGLLDLIKAGTKGRTLTYLPNLTDPNRNFACRLISPLSPVALGMDPDRGTHFGDLDVELRLRLTSGSIFSSDIWASPILFEYVAGGSLTGVTYSRATGGTYRDKFGVGQNAAAGKPRVQWRDNTQHLLLEAARTEVITDEENFAAWTPGGTPILTSGQLDPFGGTAAYLIQDDDAAVAENISQSVSFTGNADKAFSLFGKQGTSDDFFFGLHDGTAGAWRHGITVTWSGGIPSSVTSTGSGTIFPVEAWTAGWWRFLASAVGIIAANTNNFIIKMTRDVNADIGSTYFFGANAWNATFPSSYQGPSLGTRNADSLNFPYNSKPQASWCYIKFIELGTINITNARLLSLGTSGGAGPFLIFYAPAGFYALHHNNATTTVTSTVAAAPVFGDRVELFGRLFSDGSVQLAQSINGAAETTASRSAALTLQAAWSSSTLYLNGDGVSGFTGIQRVLHGTGTISSLAEARRL